MARSSDTLSQALQGNGDLRLMLRPGAALAGDWAPPATLEVQRDASEVAGRALQPPALCDLLFKTESLGLHGDVVDNLMPRLSLWSWIHNREQVKAPPIKPTLICSQYWLVLISGPWCLFWAQSSIA